MIKHVILLLFLYGIKDVRSDPDEQTSNSEILKPGIKKNEVGANGFDLSNFRNPVLEYLLAKGSDRTNAGPKSGIVREIRHSQTLLIPHVSLPGGSLPIPPSLLNQFPKFEEQKKPDVEVTRNPEQSPVENFWNFLKNKTETVGNKSRENIVTSPVLHLNKNPNEKVGEELTRIQVLPAMAVVINTFNKDGTLKNSVTHFQPDFNPIKGNTNGREAETYGMYQSGNLRNFQTRQYSINNYPGDTRKTLSQKFQVQSPYYEQSRQGVSWPFANYFPIVINDPFMSVYNAFASSMYNAVSSMVEYGPEADICRKDHNHGGDAGRDKTEFMERSDEFVHDENERRNVKETVSESAGNKKETVLDRYQSKGEKTVEDPNLFDEVVMRTDDVKKAIKEVEVGRTRRDTTSIFLRTRQGDKVDVTIEEPVSANRRERKPEERDLILRKGGIAIAGPGGAATAYTGGTAIVGPYGTVYKSPQGTAILGPFSKIVNITDDTTFEEILQMHRGMETGSEKPKPNPAGTGFRNFRNLFSYITDLPIKIEVKPHGRVSNRNRPNVLTLREQDIVKAIEETRQEEFRRIVEDTPVEEKMLENNKTTLIFRPKSKAEAGRNGVALSAPTSHAILYPGQKANIYFEPESVASAGPSGFAHAHSDLFVSYVPNGTTITQSEKTPTYVRNPN